MLIIPHRAPARNDFPPPNTQSLGPEITDTVLSLVPSTPDAGSEAESPHNESNEQAEPDPGKDEEAAEASVNAPQQEAPARDPEGQGKRLAEQLAAHIKRKKGTYVRAEDGTLYVVFENDKIPINLARDNYKLARLVMKVCDVSTLSHSAQVAIQRLQVRADARSGKIRTRKFSALSDDGKRMYIPTSGGKLLALTEQGASIEDNGSNFDFFWVEHPTGEAIEVKDARSLYKLFNDSASVQQGLDQFERLLVETQSCAVREMRWLVAMNEALFPFVRDDAQARLILCHRGGSQQGKTSGAQRFVKLHGLGDVKGDVTIASLGNYGDIGLLIIDNIEHANLTPQLRQFLLYSATGAERARSFSDGTLRLSRHRPVVVLTSIEGVYKEELQNRCLEIEYALPTGTRPEDYLRRHTIEREISANRNQMVLSLLNVLQRYFQIKAVARHTPTPRPEFAEHFEVLCNLLRAYGGVSGRDAEWAESIIRRWAEVISGSRTEEEDELEHPLSEIFRALLNGPADDNGALKVHHRVKWGGQVGALIVTNVGALLSALERQCSSRNKSLPHAPNGLSRRLNAAKFRSFKFVTAETAPELAERKELRLRRTKNERPIAFFIEESEGDE